MSQLETLFICSNSQTMVQFYTDLISSSVFSNQVSYLQKYHQSELQDYSMVLCGQYIIKQIIQTVIKSNLTKLAQIKQIVNNQLIHILQNNNTQPLQLEQMTSLIVAISQAIYNRLQQIKSKYILNAVALGSLHLIDVNWKITKTLSSQARSFIDQKLPYLFKITLYLKENNPNIQANLIKAITLQLSKVQLRQFIGQLKSLKSQM